MIKRTIAPIVLVFSFLSITFCSCDKVVDIAKDLLSSGDASAALKEALRVGADTSVTRGSAVDGYFANELIKILLPPEADPIISAIGLIPGGNALVNGVVLKLNRAAENAAPEAKTLLINAITGITIADAINIVNGGTDAATQYLRTATQDSINVLFKPFVENSLDEVGAQTAWTQLTGAYNSLPLVTPVNSDLAGYTTQKASDGLFTMIAQEEKKIREDPLHQVSEILRKVFGAE